MDTQYNTKQAHEPSQDHIFTGEALEKRLSDEPGSLGVDLDGTNPGSREHVVEDYHIGASTLNQDTSYINSVRPGPEEDSQDENADSDTETDDRNTGDEHMRIDEEGNEMGENDQI